MAREPKKSAKRFNWRLFFGIAALGVVCVSTAMAAFKVRHYMITDPQFTLSHDRKDALHIQGLNHASRLKVQHVFAADFGASIFEVPLGERRRRLLAIDWVEDASVSRLWPDRLVVRIRERKPVAFVLLNSTVLLIDSQGVLLDPPPQAQFAFPVLSGVRESETEPQRKERVQALLRVQEELGSSARDISEVNAADLENIRMVAQVDNRAVELIMGDTSFARRYRNFLSHYPEIRKRSPEVKTFDLRLDDRITAKDQD